LKIEISNRYYNDRYEIKNYLGISIKVMVEQDMFAHKLCALLDRSSLTNRDIFDIWFLMQKQTPINKAIIESRMGLSLSDYLQKCIDCLENHSKGSLLQGLGELMDPKLKVFVRNKLKSETISLLKFYKEFPI
jgi:predicted nucleotidyltransferase component of viral defense system